MIISKLENYFLPTRENKYCPVALSNKAIAIYVALFLLINIGLGWSSVLLRQTSLFANVSAQAILNLTNRARALYNLPPVAENPLLDKAAQEKAEDMIKNRYFGHFSPTGVSPWHWIKNVGYNYHYAGENLALNFVDSDAVVRAWLNSPSHRANLLNKHYKNIGIAVESGDVYGDGIKRTFVVQVFGSQFLTPLPSNTGNLAFNNNANTGSQKPIPGSSSVPTSTTSTNNTRVVSNHPAATTSVAGAESMPTSSQKLPSSTSQSSTNTITSNSTASTPSSSNSSSTTSSSPILLSSQQSKGIPEKQFLSLTKTLNPRPIKTVDGIIAGFMFLIGGINLWFVIKKPKKIDMRFPELAWRGVTIILLAVSFLLFNLSAILGGPLIIS